MLSLVREHQLLWDPDRDGHIVLEGSFSEHSLLPSVLLLFSPLPGQSLHLVGAESNINVPFRAEHPVS